ncbi:MAG: hypothetical protein KAS64_06335 [Spirochaetes bacterium]|nr:hypothetical protein [Spirochaetota bacterium]
MKSCLNNSTGVVFLPLRTGNYSNRIRILSLRPLLSPRLEKIDFIYLTAENGEFAEGIRVRIFSAYQEQKSLTVLYPTKGISKKKPVHHLIMDASTNRSAQASLFNP